MTARSRNNFSEPTDRSSDVPANSGRYPNRFKPGQSGNPKGRPKGSRNKLSEVFLTDLYADWQENGADVIAKVREKKPDVYLKVIASLLPKQFDVNAGNEFEDWTDEELKAQLQELDKVIRPHLAERDSDEDQVDDKPNGKVH